MQHRFTCIALAAALSGSGAAAQTPEFEVVSIKPSRFTAGAVLIGTQSSPETITLTGIKLRDLIARAYSLQPHQVSGPGRLDDEYYDIVAKSERPVPDAVQRQMLQSMLASRFQMKAHRETKETAVYAMVADKDGHKLKSTPADDPLPPRVFPNAAMAIRGNNISLDRLAQLLAPKTDRPVLNRTGIAGAFDIELKWAADTDPEPGPSLFTAIQEQLGLKLEATRSPVETLVVDSIEKPSEN